MAGEMWTLEQTRIGLAIKQNSIPALKMALEEGENIEFQDRKGNTYLHYVCTMYRPYVFYIVAASHININARNKHGNTALHVTALHKECGHISDLMMCGADPFVKNKDGKIASELNPKAFFWQTIYAKYQPGIFHAVELHDVERVRSLLHCWCRTDAVRDGQTLRQFAAARKHHDIVLMLDQHRHTMDAIFGVLEANEAKVAHAVDSPKCNINFLNQASELQHILQHAILLKDLKIVQLVCKAGANVNIPICLGNYIRAPLYFSAISPHLPLDIVWTVLKTKADFLLKDQRGRNAVVFALDKSNRTVALEIIEYMMQNGVYLADRDMTGVTARDVARLARRHDVVSLLDRMYIKLLRGEEMEKLERLAQDGYDSMLITANHRDTYIYACGNETDLVVRFIHQLPAFQGRVEQLQKAVRSQAVDVIRQLLEDHPTPYLLANCKDKGGRSLLHLCVLHWRTDVMAYLLSLPYIQCDALDNLLRSAYHYACAMEEDEERAELKGLLLKAGCDTKLFDCNCLRAEDYENGSKKGFNLNKERKAGYGMDKQLVCVDKYEDLRAIVRHKRKTLKDFKAAIKHFKYPVTSFTRVLEPVMDDYRDLIFVAVDSGHADIAEYLAHLGSDLVRKEKYCIKRNVKNPDMDSGKESICSQPVKAAPSAQDNPKLEVPSSHTSNPENAQTDYPDSAQTDNPDGTQADNPDTIHTNNPDNSQAKNLEDKPEDSQSEGDDKPLFEKGGKEMTSVEYLSVIERAHQLGLEDLVQVLEKKLQFLRKRKLSKKATLPRDICGDSGSEDVMSNDNDNEYLSDFDLSD